MRAYIVLLSKKKSQRKQTPQITTLRPAKLTASLSNRKSECKNEVNKLTVHHQSIDNITSPTVGMPKLFFWKSRKRSSQKNRKSQTLSTRPKHNNAFRFYFLGVMNFYFKLFIYCTTPHNNSDKVMIKTSCYLVHCNLKFPTPTPKTLFEKFSIYYILMF